MIVVHGDTFLGAGSLAALESANQLVQTHMEVTRAPSEHESTVVRRIHVKEAADQFVI